MQRLLSMLDDEVRTLSELVECTQREQQHLLAFEPEALEAVVAEKQRLLAQEDRLRSAREQAVQSALRAHGATGGETLSQLAEVVPPALAGGLRDRRDSLRALLAALSELNATTGFHAVRQLRWARGYRRRLTGQTGEPAYDRTGGAHRPGASGLRLSASV